MHVFSSIIIIALRLCLMHGTVLRFKLSDDLRKASEVSTLVQSSEIDHINYYCVLCPL
jgi:hypothetical protein